MTTKSKTKKFAKLDCPTECLKINIFYSRVKNYTPILRKEGICLYKQSNNNAYQVNLAFF